MSGALLAQSAGIIAAGGNNVEGGLGTANRILALHLDSDFTDIHGHTFAAFSGDPQIVTDLKKFGAGALTGGSIIATVPSAAWNGCYMGLWVYISSSGFGGSLYQLFQITDNPGTKYAALSIDTYDWPICRFCVDTYGGFIYPASATLSLDAWHWLAVDVTVSGSSRVISLQQDGVEVGTGTKLSSILPTSAASYAAIISGSVYSDMIRVDDAQMFNATKGIIAAPTAAFPDS